MRGITTVTIEQDAHSVDVLLRYEATPGEPRVMYTRNGDGYPGSPPSAEVISVQGVGWHVCESGEWVERKRQHGTALWELLDRWALAQVEVDASYYEDCCLEAAAGYEY